MYLKGKVENTISNLPKVPRATFLESNALFCFISICKLGSFKNPLVTITSLSELYYRTRRFILLVQTKKVNPLTKFTSSSSSSTKFKDIVPWNISQMIMNTVLISMRLVISYAIKRGIPLWIWWKVNGNWDNNMIRIFPMEGKPL